LGDENWNNLNGAAAPRQLRPTPTWGGGSGIKVIYGVVAPAQPPRMDWCASNGHIVAAVHESDHGTKRTPRELAEMSAVVGILLQKSKIGQHQKSRES